MWSAACRPPRLLRGPPTTSLRGAGALVAEQQLLRVVADRAPRSRRRCEGTSFGRRRSLSIFRPGETEAARSWKRHRGGAVDGQHGFPDTARAAAASSTATAAPGRRSVHGPRKDMRSGSSMPSAPRAGGPTRIFRGKSALLRDRRKYTTATARGAGSTHPIIRCSPDERLPWPRAHQDGGIHVAAISPHRLRTPMDCRPFQWGRGAWSRSSPAGI